MIMILWAEYLALVQYLSQMSHIKTETIYNKTTFICADGILLIF